jgi:hypothetical protein
VIARIVTGLAIPEPARTVLLLGDRAYAEGWAPQNTATPQNTVGTTDTMGTTELPDLTPARLIPVPRQASEPSDYGDVTAVYATRSEFMSRMPPHALLDGASQIRASGLSLNLICHHYADNRLIDLINRGARLRLLFLDPDGQAIGAREREEGYAPGHLSMLTTLNIQNMLRRVRDRVEPQARANLEVAVYDETVRFNILLLDDRLCIAQPYLPELRGVDSPTLVMRPRAGTDGLFTTFNTLFDRLWQRAQPR